MPNVARLVCCASATGRPHVIRSPCHGFRSIQSPRVPTVSVIMAFHRVTPFLRPAVQSVLTQTCRDLELILTDNGTGAGLAPLGELGRDPRIRLISHRSNLGIPNAHNAAVAVACGEFIAFSDYDDVSLPQRLEKQVAALRADPTLSLVSSCAETIDEHGTVVGREFALLGAQEQRVFSAYTTPAPSPSYTGRRKVFEQLPFRSEFPVAGDYDFIARVADAGRITGVADVLFHYRRHAGQSTWQHRASQTLSASCIRLVTARRRSGRAEGFAELAAELQSWRDEPPAVREIYADFAGRCLRENFPVLAAYHARKLLSVTRDVAACGVACRTVVRALRLAPREASLIVRMFLTGPLRTHGLRPA